MNASNLQSMRLSSCLEFQLIYNSSDIFYLLSEPKIKKSGHLTSIYLAKEVKECVFQPTSFLLVPQMHHAVSPLSLLCSVCKVPCLFHLCLRLDFISFGQSFLPVLPLPIFPNYQDSQMSFCIYPYVIFFFFLCWFHCLYLLVSSLVSYINWAHWKGSNCAFVLLSHCIPSAQNHARPIVGTQ